MLWPIISLVCPKSIGYLQGVERSVMFWLNQWNEFFFSTKPFEFKGSPNITSQLQSYFSYEIILFKVEELFFHILHH